MRTTGSDQFLELARDALRWPVKAWLMLVQHYADKAASDPARRAERLERPPMFAGAHASERWHAAEMQYRSQLHQLQQEAERKTEKEGAPWWRLVSILYSAEMFWMVVAVCIAVAILRALGEW